MIIKTAGLFKHAHRVSNEISNPRRNSAYNDTI